MYSFTKESIFELRSGEGNIASSSQKQVGQAKVEEATAWSHQKKEMVDLSAMLTSQMEDLTARMLDHDKQIGKVSCFLDYQPACSTTTSRSER